MAAGDTALLGRVPLFGGLDQADLAALGARLRHRRYARGEAVFLKGDPGTSLCIVETGRVKLGFTSVEGRAVIFDLLGPGEEFGELALLDGEPRSADAVAVEASKLLLLDRDEFVRYLENHARLGLQLMSILSRRLRRDAELIQDAVFLDVPARVARTLLRLAIDDLSAGQTGVRRTPRLIQSDLAGMVGTTRETLNKWLATYESQGLIRLEKGGIVVLQPEVLRQRIY
jgi:CRP/FNR family transcriptional regulator, cyclic AMP receptor protein